jgi:REP element-mobilizing transposase RayT
MPRCSSNSCVLAVAQGELEMHDFVVMPNRAHLLLTIGDEMTIEKSYNSSREGFLAGRFSRRLSKQFGYFGEVWQGGFSEVRADNGEKFLA